MEGLWSEGIQPWCEYFLNLSSAEAALDVLSTLLFVWRCLFFYQDKPDLHEITG